MTKQSELFFALLNDFKGDKNLLIWPGQGSFEVVVGAILVQNTSWKNVEKALQNLKNARLLRLETLAKIPLQELALCIKASGFYNIKAKRLKTLCEAILSDFGNFENFKANVSREWLLGVKGVGAETCDAILAYACEQTQMVVDAYALRILGYLGYEFEFYDEAKEWLSDLLFDEIYAKTKLKDEGEVFRIFHALIVEFCKKHFKGKILNESGKKALNLI
ncbi:MAG: endonuclease III [Campylobacter sp.]|nr:endonuclease III [Campylobacter sp.]